jgi:phosphoribosylaminoimidazole (AIR) synthetase
MSVVVPADEADLALEILRECGESPYIIGEIIKSDETIVIC